MLTSPVIVTGDEGWKGTNNAKGFEMSVVTKHIDELVQCYDGKHPIIDIGCAYGRNSAAAATALQDGSDLGAVKVLAAGTFSISLTCFCFDVLPSFRIAFTLFSLCLSNCTCMNFQ